MKQLTLIIALFITTIGLNAQYYDIGNVSLKACVYDTSQTISQIDGWDLYQTDNDLWSGVPLELCHEVIKENYRLILNLENIDTNKPIFIKSNTSSELPIFLTPNWIYGLESNGYMDPDVKYKLSENCGEGICTGIILNTTIFDDDWNEILSKTNEFQFDNYFNLGACVPTDYSNIQLLNEIIVKISFDSISHDQEILQLPVRTIVFMENYGEPTLFDLLTVPSNCIADPEYNVNIANMVTELNSYHFLGLHDPNIIPSPNHIDSIEVVLEENVSNSSIINIEVDYYQTISFQSNTTLVGGLVMNDDSIRHQVNIVQDGGDFCFFSVELVFSDHTNLKYRSGDINLASQLACLNFRNGSKLIIDNSELNYGSGKSIGMMVLGTGSKVEMIGQSKLIFYNTLKLMPSKGTTYNYVDVYLERGQSLVFAKSADVIAMADVKVKVHMLGGTIDISNLSEANQAVFEFEYPLPPTSIEDNVSLFPNPFSDQLSYTITNNAEVLMDWNITNDTGQIIASGQDKSIIGIGDYTISIPDLDCGIYYFNMKTEKGTVSKKIISIGN